MSASYHVASTLLLANRHNLILFIATTIYFVIVVSITITNYIYYMLRKHTWVGNQAFIVCFCKLSAPTASVALHGLLIILNHEGRVCKEELVFYIHRLHLAWLTSWLQPDSLCVDSVVWRCWPGFLWHYTNNTDALPQKYKNGERLQPREHLSLWELGCCMCDLHTFPYVDQLYVYLRNLQCSQSIIFFKYEMKNKELKIIICKREVTVARRRLGWQWGVAQF